MAEPFGFAINIANRSRVPVLLGLGHTVPFLNGLESVAEIRIEVEVHFVAHESIIPSRIYTSIPR